MVFCVHRFPPKNEPTNSTLLLRFLRSTCFRLFLEKIDDPKNHFEINWPLAGTLNWKLFVLWKHIVGLQKRKWFLHKKVAYATQICRKVSAVPLKIEAQITKLYKNNHFALFLQFSKLCLLKTHTHKKFRIVLNGSYWMF